MPSPDRRPDRPRRGAPGRPAKRAGGAAKRPTASGGGSRGAPRSGASAKRSGAPAKRSGALGKRSGAPAKRSGAPGKRGAPSRGAGRGDERGAKPGPRLAGDRRWGGVARRGAAQIDPAGAPRGTGRMGRDDPSKASEVWRAAMPAERTGTDTWIDEGIVGEAESAVDRSRSGRGRRRPEPEPEPKGDPTVARAVAPERLEKFEQRMRDAARAFSRERYEDARRMLKSMSKQAPTAQSVRELHGLTLYRMGRWKEAVRELETFHELSGSVEQHPVLADCKRALGQHGKVWELWEELRSVSPSAQLVAEGRIVAAGSLADQGRLRDAISLLEAAKVPSKRPKEHHLRVAYALADLHERAGDVPRARQLFELVARHDPDLGDVAARLRNL
jgi:hypothetical protein